MTWYQKKPRIVQAIRWTGKRDSLKDLRLSRQDEVLLTIDPDCSLLVETAEGRMKCPVGHYLIRGVEGELYPCAPRVFDQSYLHVGERL